MAGVISHEVVKNLAVRDTNARTYGPYDMSQFKPGTVRLIYHWNLNQAGTIAFNTDLRGNFDAIGGVIAPAANAGYAIRTSSSDIALNLCDGNVRFVVTATLPPTSGDVSLWLQGEDIHE